MKNRFDALQRYEHIIRDYINEHCVDLFREPSGILAYKYIVPGSGYFGMLWDWDSWFVDIALNSIPQKEDIREYQKGCILNFLNHMDETGRMPIYITENRFEPVFSEQKTNIHKPILAQHALYVSEKIKDFSWLKGLFAKFERYIGYYQKNCKHESGLFYWIDDMAIGVDNDPCTFYRPRCSSASILLNCFMYMELQAMAKLAHNLEEGDAQYYQAEATKIKQVIQEYCWDERDGFFYSCDINLLPIDSTNWLHAGAPRHYSTLIQRIGVWSGFLAMYAGIADERQAERMVKEHMLNKNTFACHYGIRSLSKMEKMYKIQGTNNPSCWLGPVWILCNYICFKGLVKYGYFDQAKEIVEKTVLLLGKDIEENGQMHECYDPETGKTVYHLGFQSWNLLIVEMMNWSHHIKE